jgi:5'-3' exonuclease
MILVDLNQVLISNLMIQINSNPKTKIEEDLVRHIVLNSLRSYSKQFKSKYGKLVICCDSRKYWRRDVFPFYKSHRKKDRDKSDFDWGLIFDTLNKIRDELKTSFPYKVIEVESAEADDVIAVLAARFSPHEEILILSSDKDFVQLQKYDGVQQYSPILKRFIRTEDPKMFVKEHIIRGDRGDGVPNFLSSDSSIASGERQKSINNKKLKEWLKDSPSNFCETDVMKHGWSRNQLLVDFDHIPVSLQEQIVNAYDNTKASTRNDLLNYLIEKRMRNLLETLDEF